MKKSYKKGIVVVLAAALINTMTYNVYFAKTSDVIPGSVQVKFDVKKENAGARKDWMESVKTETKESLQKALPKAKTNEEKQKIQKSMEQIDKFNSSSMFADNSDGSTSLIGKLPDADIKIGDSIAKTDENSNFQIVGLSRGEYPLTISVKGSVVYRSTVKISGTGSDKLDIIIRYDDDKLNGAADLMQGSVNPVSENQQNVATAQTIYFPQYPYNTYVPWSVGKGRMWIASTPNYPECNKADVYTSDGSYSTSSFPYNNSDCGRAIGLGMLYSGNPTNYYIYNDDYYCYVEAIANAWGSITGESSGNVYCNGSYYDKGGNWKNGHINCSWFNGVQDVETLHAHP